MPRKPTRSIGTTHDIVPAGSGGAAGVGRSVAAMTGRDGVPDDPERDGWHWIDFDGWLEPRYWVSPKPSGADVGFWRGGSPENPAEWLTADARYLGPCEPPEGSGVA